MRRKEDEYQESSSTGKNDVLFRKHSKRNMYKADSYSQTPKSLFEDSGKIFDQEIKRDHTIRPLIFQPLISKY